LALALLASTLSLALSLLALTLLVLLTPRTAVSAFVEAS
jgi:hypothetical protein